jgi:type IV pilus assembly protein PilE
MNKLNMSRARGFTVIELMIVIIIIALLVALAYPSYIDYVRKAKRGEAQQLLLNWSINQEIFRSNNPEYATVAQLPAPLHDDYNFVLSDRSATTYTLTATGTGDQANDTARDGVTTCTLSLDENGLKTPAPCWE